MSELVLPAFEGTADETVAPADDFDLVAVAGGEAELPVTAGIALVAEKLEADGDGEVNTTASPVVCEGLGRAACVGCPFFRNCFGQQPEAVDKTAPPNYLEELLDEKGPAMVMARPAASKEQPSPPEASAQKQPDTPPSVAPVEELSRLLAPVEEPAVSPEATASMVELKPAVKHESTPLAVEPQRALQPPPALTELRSVPIEKQAPVSSGEYSTLRPTTPEVDTAATPTKESDGAELLAASQPMGAASVVVSPRREPTIREAAVEVNIRPIDQSPASVVVAPVPLVAVSMATEQDLLLQSPVDKGATERLLSWDVEETGELECLPYPAAPLVMRPGELAMAVDDEGCEDVPRRTEQGGCEWKQPDITSPYSEIEQNTSHEGRALAEQPGADEALDPPIRSQETEADAGGEQSPVANKIAVVEEGGVEQSDNPLEDCQTEAGVVMALQPPDIVVKSTMRELANDTAAPFENGVSPYDESLADNSPETESPVPRNDTPWWSTILGVVAVFVALQRRQGAVY